MLFKISSMDTVWGTYSTYAIVAITGALRKLSSDSNKLSLTGGGELKDRISSGGCSKFKAQDNKSPSLPKVELRDELIVSSASRC